jgi:protein phosphatase
VQLKYAKPSELNAILQPFGKIPGGILPIDSSQILVLRDYTENIKRMLEMIEKIDVVVPSEFVSEVIPIKYAKAGEIASALGLETFAKGFGPPPAGAAPGEVEAALRNGVDAANQAVHAAAAKKRAYAGMGTTITAAYVDGDSLYLAQVGDSRAYLLRDGVLTQLTVDHTLVQEMIARGEIDEELARIHPLRHVITRALGTFPAVTADISRRDLKRSDVVLVCSDGLSSKLETNRIQTILTSAAGLDKAADELVRAALDAGGEDNITLILMSEAEDVGA